MQPTFDGYKKSKKVIEMITDKIYEVESPLNEVIRHFYYVRNASTGSPVMNLIPNYEILLVFNFGSPISVAFNNDIFGDHFINQVAVIGPLKKMMSYELQPGAELLGVVFTLNGFYRLFNLPIHELSGKDIQEATALIKDPTLTKLHAKLWAEPNFEKKFLLLRTNVTSLIANNEPGFEMLIDSISHFNNPAIEPVKAIAQETSQSARTVQLRFQKYLGFSPKEMLRFIRFKTMLQQVLHQENNKIDLFELIEAYGYHDQSHLTKDFKHYMGTTPGKFIKEITGKEYCSSKPGKHY